MVKKEMIAMLLAGGQLIRLFQANERKTTRDVKSKEKEQLIQDRT